MRLAPSERYALLGMVAGLIAPAGLFLFAVTMHRALDPVGLFVVLAAGGMMVFAVVGRMIGRRDEALVARNRELQVLSAQFEELSARDALTGIANRRSFDARLDMELGRSVRYGVPCALVMIDLDRFKLLNDRFGHPAGDEVLRRVAALLEAEKRSGDLIARYGGEEFVAILPHNDAFAGAAWAERARARLAAERVPWDGAELSITASFGVAPAPADAAMAAELIEAADRALYEAKRQGGNRTVSSPDPSPVLLRPTLRR